MQLSNTNCLFYCSEDSLNQVNMPQIFTPLEYKIFSYQTILQWDGNLFKRGAIQERHILKSFQLLAEFCTCQIFTTLECLLTNKLDGKWIDAPQRSAVSERRISNYLQFAAFDIRQVSQLANAPSSTFLTPGMITRLKEGQREKALS